MTQLQILCLNTPYALNRLIVKRTLILMQFLEE